MKNYKESNVLIIITALKKIITIFFGPFLTAYFIKVSPESIIDLSIYNIVNYIYLGIGGFIVGWIIRNKFQIGMFRVGIISNFIYILSIIIMKENILNHLYLISFLYGFSAITYFFPYNLFITSKIRNKERIEYEFKKKTITTLISIITPIILGSIITTTNFELTAIIILCVSLLQIIFSFFIKPIENENYIFTPIKSYKILIKDKEIKNILLVDFFKGMNVSDGALEVVLTILIFNSFRTDLNLGILSSISSAFIITMQYCYTKFFYKKNNKLIVVICSLLPMFSLLLLLLYTNNITLTLYYFCYNTFVNVLCLILEVKLFNIAKCETIGNDNKIEFWAIREAILNLGRIVGYFLLLIVGIYFGYNYLYYLMIILTLSIALMSYFFNKVGNYDDID